MNTPPSGPSVIMSSAEPLHSQGSDSRFPFATAFAALVVVQTGLALVPVVVFMLFRFDVPDVSWPVRLAGAIAGGIITFFIFRWAINKHIVGNVAPATDALVEYGGRLSFKNPFLAGLIAYWAIGASMFAATDPITNLLTRQALAPAGLVGGWAINIIVGYFAFTLAVKRVVLRPYRVKRLLPMLGLVFMLSLLIPAAISLGKARQEWAFRNHVICEVLRPGMTKVEVTDALNVFREAYQVSGEFFQVNLRERFEGPGTEGVTAFAMPRFQDSYYQSRLHMILGYDSQDKLTMINQETDVNYVQILTPFECPLSFP